VGTPWIYLLQPHAGGVFHWDFLEDEDDAEFFISAAQIKLDGNGKVRMNCGLVLDQTTKELAYLIDNDFFTEQQTESENARDTLTDLNRESGCLFRSCITAKLYTALDPRAI
jgi:uncharacterized protein (TIGR04255 family)